MGIARLTVTVVLLGALSLPWARTAASGEGKTAVKKEDRSTDGDRRRILPRKELTDAELERLEKKRSERRQDAERILRIRRAEYDGVPWSDAYRIRSPHYLVISNSTRSVAQMYSWVMEALFRELSTRFRGKFRSRPMSTVYVYKNEDEFQDRTGAWGAGGFYNPRTKEIHTYHGTFGMTGTTFRVLAHEGTHQFQGLVLKDFSTTPIWLIEGLAVYYGDGSEWDSKRKRIRTGRIPRDRLLHIQEKMREKNHTPLRELMRMSRRKFSGSHYADAWSFIYFLVHSGKKGQDFLNAYWMLSGLRKPTYDDFRELGKKYFGGTAEIEAAWVKFIGELTCPAPGRIEGDYFIGDEFNFEVKLPDPKWNYFQYNTEREGFLVGLLSPDGAAACEIFYTNNFDQKEREDYIEDYVKRFLPIRHHKIQYGPHAFGEIQGYRLAYEDSGKVSRPSGTGGISSIEDFHRLMREGKEASRKTPKEPEKHLEFKLVDIDFVFSIVCSAKPKDFDRFAADFDRIGSSFTLILERRW